jgi:Mn-containing catalase
MTDRKQVRDHTRVMTEYETRNISEFIKELQELQSEGWGKIELEKESEYDGDYHYVRVTKTRPETDSEYNSRIAQENKMKETRRNAYEILKKEFGE